MPAGSDIPDGTGVVALSEAAASAGPTVAGDETAPRVVVHICVLTFRRPEGLRRLLDSLADLRFRNPVVPDVRIVIVDNDVQASARQTCDDARPRLPWPLLYIVEPTRGIAQARNTAVRAASESADFVAFVDDDEVPDALWLDEVLRVQRTFNADVVAGPVFPRYEGEIPAYVRKGHFHDPAHRATGTRLDRAHTGNVLARSHVFRAMPALFDERLGLIGGEDVHFFRRVARAGFSIVWAGEARIEEWVPQSRTTAAWILKRAFRTGNTLAICDRELRESTPRFVWLCVRAAGSIAKRMLALPLSPLAGRHEALKCLGLISRSAGYLAGAAGFRYEEYRTVHGT